MSGQLLTQHTWRGYRRAEFPDDCWAVEGDTLHALPGAIRVSLISRERFGDFDLSLDWRLPVGGNSGILYRVSEDEEAPSHSGPEMQLVHNAGHPDGQSPETSCGALYGLKAPRDVPQCPPGLFNVARVSVRGSRIEHWLNGVCVLACDMASDEFRKRVAASKFRAFARFAHHRDGHIVLQHHGGEAWFCNIRIEFPGAGAAR